MTQIDEISEDFTGVIEGFTPSCASCRAAGVMLERVSKKFPGINFYKTDLSGDTPLARMLSDSTTLPVVVMVDKGELVFNECGMDGVAKLKIYLEENYGSMDR